MGSIREPWVSYPRLEPPSPLRTYNKPEWFFHSSLPQGPGPGGRGLLKAGSKLGLFFSLGEGRGLGGLGLGLGGRAL